MNYEASAHSLAALRPVVSASGPAPGACLSGNNVSFANPDTVASALNSHWPRSETLGTWFTSGRLERREQGCSGRLETMARAHGRRN